jgi:hypothetical protein
MRLPRSPLLREQRGEREMKEKEEEEEEEEVTE